LPIASGPHGFISFVDSDLYPVEADELRKIFIPALTSPFPATTAHSPLMNTLTLQKPSNIEKEAETKKEGNNNQAPSYPHLWLAQQ
jgi:hypothetical protein